ncbi:DUF294 nucleotidyltransferase-like domain-containing protein [Nitrincola alkalilacustris]|uniref:DUF294 nucleotidyltransferase-like domain-containing protein n=1 Tax=Nitrincola alkalilacustris TaxID=1571224 RepID=UPI00124E19BD|nr:DUF294 nucleotidyltransferase-like domain-containing protein [Nitrincola alkalilacustris]
MYIYNEHSPWRILLSERGAVEAASWPAALHSLKSVLQEMYGSPDLGAARRLQPDMVRELFALDIPAWRISQLLSDHNDWVYRRSIELSLEEMLAQGWGSPPCRFCILSLGSGARHESLLSPDQDNAMIIESYPDQQHHEIDTWFQALAERFTDRLDQADIPLCKGHVMARWPLWRKNLDQWCEQMRFWTRRRVVRQVQFSNILLDFYPVYGDVSLCEAFRDCIVEIMPNAGLFLGEMSDLLDETPVALDRFGRVQGDGRDAPHATALNIKRQGLLPLQSALRLLSLRAGIRAIDSRGRLRALVECRVISEREASALDAALGRLQSLLLQSQMASLEQGRMVDGWINQGQLDEAGLQLLRLDLLQIQQLQKRARVQAHS